MPLSGDAWQHGRCVGTVTAVPSKWGPVRSSASRSLRWIARDPALAGSAKQSTAVLRGPGALGSDPLPSRRADQVSLYHVLSYGVKRGRVRECITAAPVSMPRLGRECEASGACAPTRRKDEERMLATSRGERLRRARRGVAMPAPSQRPPTLAPSRGCRLAAKRQ